MTMLEKMRDALIKSFYANVDHGLSDDEMGTRQAIAALEALHEPSDEMLKAVTADRLLPPQYALSATDFWQAMIDAALNEEQKS